MSGVAGSGFVCESRGRKSRPGGCREDAMQAKSLAHFAVGGIKLLILQRGVQICRTPPRGVNNDHCSARDCRV